MKINIKTTIPTFDYFLSKSYPLIYKLCIGKGNAKERLKECETEINIMLHASVPEILIPLKEKIRINLFYSGFRCPNEKDTASMTASLHGKRNSTASIFIKDIYDLHTQVKSYIDYPVE
jgi:hypothetical protein